MRNNKVDCIRGFAMLLVVLGHTLSGSTYQFQNSILFQIIWTLQMPLFIIISGYVTRYSKALLHVSDLWKFIKKRTLAYLVPWCLWSFLIRGVIWGQYNYLDIKWLLWHMDSGYWFLITIWTIAMLFGIADYVSNKVTSNIVKSILSHLVICGFGMVVLAGIGYVLGLSFFCIKLTLYYLPIYLIGYLYGQLQDILTAKKYFSIVKNIVIAICLSTWLALIIRIDFFGGDDSGMFILLRFVTSILGCCAVIGLFTGSSVGEGCRASLGWIAFSGNIPLSLSISESDKNGGIAYSSNSIGNDNADSKLCSNIDTNYSNNKNNTNEQCIELSALWETNTSQFLKWVGVHSLEVYLVHGFSLCLLKFENAPIMGSWESWVLFSVNFLITVGLSCMYIKIIESNKILNKMLFWK